AGATARVHALALGSGEGQDRQRQQQRRLPSREPEAAFEGAPGLDGGLGTVDRLHDRVEVVTRQQDRLGFIPRAPDVVARAEPAADRARHTHVWPRPPDDPVPSGPHRTPGYYALVRPRRVVTEK